MEQTLLSPEVEVFLRLCSKVDSDFSRNAARLLSSRDPAFLEIKADPRDYSSMQSFRDDYLVANFLSKWKGLRHIFKVNTKDVALTSWTASEELCRTTNSRLRLDRDTNFSTCPHNQVLCLAMRKIDLIFGELDVPTVLKECEWTGGATALTRYGTPLAEKMSQPIAVTRSASNYFRACLESDPHWVSVFLDRYPDGPVSLLHAYKQVEWNRFLTVPKSAKTDRVIAAEPAGNSFLQKGVGSYLRRRLLRHGISLDDQGHNQRLAQRAQKECLATLDLKSASDTISIETIRTLVPPQWFEFLNDLRCKYTKRGQSVSRLEKFSSMGNAFTFELESIIFYGISYAVCQKNNGDPSKVSIYGDDIICEQFYAEELIQVLEYFGFQTNVAKSYTSGRFYESCGSHYYDGCYVTPVYQKEEVGDLLHERIRLYNRIVRWGHIAGGAFCSATGTSVRYLRRKFNISKETVYGRSVPAVPQCSTSDDGYLVDPSWLPSYDINSGYYCTVYRFRAQVRASRCPSALYAYKLRRPSYSNADPRGGESETQTGAGAWRKQKSYIQNWPVKKPVIDEMSIIGFGQS